LKHQHFETPTPAKLSDYKDEVANCKYNYRNPFSYAELFSLQ